jgi:serine/threonine-protein kinase/endoribonuclease IRE1
MPRPPGPGFTLLALFLLPSLLVAAQQQQHDAHQRVPSPPPRVQQARAMPAPPPPPPPPGPDRPYTPILAQNERALATKVSSAPAVKAVRARPGAGAASGVLAPSARLLRDWEVEDFVLLATVDGHIHARDRYDGRVIWELPGTPMLQTIYNSSEDRARLRDQAFVWIVEPREDGALYVLTPGPYPALQSLGLTVKQLTDLAPYASDDPDLPVVYNVEKRTFMLNIDAATGLVKQSFSPSGMFGRNDDSCASPVRNYFRERDCRGTFEIGQTEYIISIHNKKTNEHVCTIKYAEWTSNKRDTDLKAQYTKTMDNHYIHGKYDGRFAAYDYRRPRPFQRPLFEESLPYPVARVFDVARPSGDESDNAPLVLLPQPAGPQSDETRVNRVLLNTTETGAWYALSEMNYPTITDGAPQAACYNRDDLLTLDEHYSLPADEKTLIGVHEMDRFEAPSRFRTIAAPTEYRNENGQVISIPPDPSPREVHTIDPPPVTYTQAIPHISPPTLVFLVIFLCLIISWAKWMDGPGKLAPFWSYLSEKLHAQSFTAHSHVPATLEPEKPRTEQVMHEAPTDTAPVAAEISPENAIDEPGLDLPAGLESKEKKVTFDIPDERSDDLTPLSRTTTAEQGSPDNSEEDPFAVTSNAAVSPLNDGAESTPQDPMAPQTTPKKKKSHRGKRGGRKLSMRQQKDDDEVGRIVDAAKQLDPSPSLHPDEITMNGDDMQDVTNIKRIGKLTIDQDRLLGNGSGGTFVFEGKWNVSSP